MEDDAERVDWGNDDDELQAPPESYPSDSPQQATGGYAGEDAEDAVSLGGDDEDEREFYAHHSTASTSVGGGALLTKSSAVAHSHTTKRDSQRQSTTSSQHTRAPSQSKNPESPTSGLRRTHSANTLPAPLTHALPPKPVVAPPHFRPPSPAGPGILASAMVHRQKKSNGSLKASDGGDPLPPDWEIRYPRTGGNEAYYFNVKTEESTWVRPKLPLSGTSSPTKERENGHIHLSGRRSPDDLDSALLDMSAIDRKRAPLPPQDQQWRENRKAPTAPPTGSYVNAPVAAPAPQGARFVPPPPPGDNGRRPYELLDAPPADRREDRFRAPLDDVPPGPRRAGRSPPRDDIDRMRRPLPTGPGDRHSRFDPLPSPADRMDVDGPPPPKTTPAPRSTMGGMHADRMIAEPPRGPRAMAARDGPGGPYSSVPNAAPPPPPPPPAFNARPPMGPPVDPSNFGAGRGRGRPNDRRWETNDQDRRPSFSGPPSREASAPSPFTPRRVEPMISPRDLPDRPGSRAPLPNDRRDDRPPSRISGTNNVPIGARPSDHPSGSFAPNGVRSPVDRYRRADDVGDRLRRPPPGDIEPYDRRPPPPHDLPPSDPPRGDRPGRRLSVGQEGLNRARGEPMIDRPLNALPPRPRDAPRDDQLPRQVR
ncbi:hypothetical protein TRAPUB_821 [Trametes pubescens]|uniref:WW domain-containing protein n=1 Tax=Trametes pubescens TaxID=154538 RepID=A0A1M2VL58_TRAPU|nr:hypothetical protein TRAPUB_821 [Trametes pubescens]